MASKKKQPNDVLDYDVDLTDWFRDYTEDGVASISYSVISQTESSPTLVVGPAPHGATAIIGSPSTRFKVWLGGGTNNVDYTVVLLVTTSYSRKKEVELKIKVRDK